MYHVVIYWHLPRPREPRRSGGVLVSPRHLLGRYGLLACMGRSLRHHVSGGVAAMPGPCGSHIGGRRCLVGRGAAMMLVSQDASSLLTYFRERICYGASPFFRGSVRATSHLPAACVWPCLAPLPTCSLRPDPGLSACSPRPGCPGSVVDYFASGGLAPANSRQILGR